MVVSLGGVLRAQRHYPLFHQKLNASYSKAMVKMLKCLDMADYRGAELERGRLEVESHKKSVKDTKYTNTYVDAVQPLWDIVSIYFMANATYRAIDSELAYNPRKGYERLKVILKDDYLVTESNAFMSYATGNNNLSTEKLKDSIEEILLEEARSRKTEAAYDELLTTLYRSRYEDVCRRERELVAYANVKMANSIGECERYIKKYGKQNAYNLAEVENLLAELRYGKLGENVTDWRTYVKDFPDSKHAAQLRLRIAEHERKLAHEALIQRKVQKHPNHCLLAFNGCMVRETETQTWQGTAQEPAYVERSYYNELGLLTRNYHSKNGNVTYEYACDSLGGYYVSKVSSAQTGVLAVTPVLDKGDNFVELHYGDRYVEYVDYDASSMYVVSRSMKFAGKESQDRYYTYKEGKETSVKRNGVELVHAYNSRGEIDHTSKVMDGVVMETTYFAYEYDRHGNWIRMEQRDEKGRQILRRQRSITYR